MAKETSQSHPVFPSADCDDVGGSLSGVLSRDGDLSLLCYSLCQGATRPLRLALGAVVIGCMAGNAQAAVITLTVDPFIPGDYAAISAAVASETAGNTYVINIAPGIYTNDFSVFNAPTTVNGAGATIETTTPPPNGKGVFTTTSSLTVDGLSFVALPGSALDPSLGGNASAIREQATGPDTLTLSGITVDGFQDGVLTDGSDYQDVVTISNSVFINNGSDGGQTHAIYVGDAASLTVINTQIAGTIGGHAIKSRAASTTVQGSTLWVGTNVGAPAGAGVGSGSLAIDLPNGGVGQISGNTIYQGSANTNGSLIRFGEEGIAFPTNSLDVSNTVFDNVDPGVGNTSLAIDQMSTCITPVTGASTDTFIGTTPITPTGCYSGPPPVVTTTADPVLAAAAVTAGPVQAPEPPSLAILSSALLGMGWAVGRRYLSPSNNATMR